MSGKKRGLSLEEKRNVVLEMLQESKTIWVLKEIEKQASKRGVVQQTVKDVVMSLVHDELAVMDKVGTSNFFWAFPSEVANKRRKRQELLEAQLAEQRAKRAELAGKLEAQRASCPDSEERTAALRRLDAARATSASLQAELAQFAANDPAYLEKVKKLEDSGLAHANRWTDGLFLMKSFLEKLHGRNAEIDGFFENAGVDTEKLEYMTCETLLTPPRTAAMSSGGARKKAGGASGGGSGKGKKRPAPEAIEDD